MIKGYWLKLWTVFAKTYTKHSRGRPWERWARPVSRYSRACSSNLSVVVRLFVAHLCTTSGRRLTTLIPCFSGVHTVFFAHCSEYDNVISSNTDTLLTNIREHIQREDIKRTSSISLTSANTLLYTGQFLTFLQKIRRHSWREPQWNDLQSRSLQHSRINSINTIELMVSEKYPLLDDPISADTPYITLMKNVH